MSASRKTPSVIEDKIEIGLDFYYTPEHYNDCLTSILIPHGIERNPRILSRYFINVNNK